MNGMNDWDHNVEGDAVEVPVECVCRDVVVQALDDMNVGKTIGQLMLCLSCEGCKKSIMLKEKSLAEYR